MGFFSNLLGLGALAGAAAGAFFVTKKYQENAKLKQQLVDIATSEDGEAIMIEDNATFIEDVKKAATDVYDDAVVSVKTTAEKVGIDTEEFSGAMGVAGKAIANASKAVASTVKENAPDVADNVKLKADKVVKKAKNKIYGETGSEFAEVDSTDFDAVDIDDVFSAEEEVAADIAADEIQSDDATKA